MCYKNQHLYFRKIKSLHLHRSLPVSVSPHQVRLLGPVDAEEQLGGQEVTQVLHAVGAGVLVVVASFPVVAETVGVLHTQIEALSPQKGPGTHVQVNSV